MNESSVLAAHQQAILIGGGIALFFILSALVLQGGGPSRTVRWARAMIVLSAVAAVGGLAWVWAGCPLIYKSTAVVRISPRAQKIVFDTKDDTSPIYAQYVSTETSVIRSPTVIERVLDRAEVRESAWFKNATKLLTGSRLDGVNLLTLQVFHTATPTSGNLGEQLQQALEVTPRCGTELIDVSFAAASPRDARIITDAIVQEYLALKEKTDKDSGSFVREKLSDEQARLQFEIDGLIKTRFSVAEKVGTSDPEQLRTALSADESAFTSRLQEKLRELELKRWELELHDAASMQPVTTTPGQSSAPTSPGTGQPDSASIQARKRTLRFEIERLQREIELMAKDRDAKKGKMREVGETALELAKYDEQIRQKRELYEQVRLRREQLQMEDNAPTRVKIVAYAGEPATPVNDERLTWTTLIVVGLAALVLVFRSIARSAAAA